MAETFREREAPKAQERVLPAIRREEREQHTPIDVLGRSAVHMRTPAQLTRPGAERAVARADFDMRVARNVSELRLEGSTPLPERFLKMLEGLG
ncbi:hypothetical protein L0Y65_04095 [Candidatus Micrarchaeota archaeon]|nr:hypothetical protein [Candidatus Micrarchaeota archaeon]